MRKITKVSFTWGAIVIATIGLFYGVRAQDRACLREMALDHVQYRWEIVTERWSYGSRSYKCWNYVSDENTWELYDRQGKLVRTLSRNSGSEIIYARELR